MFNGKAWKNFIFATKMKLSKFTKFSLKLLFLDLINKIPKKRFFLINRSITTVILSFLKREYERIPLLVQDTPAFRLERS
jgi:hypothetical protein